MSTALVGTGLVGTGSLVRLILRRDRVRLAVWVVLLAILPAVTASSFAELFPTEQARAAYAAGLEANPALLSIQGPIYGTSLGALTVARALTFSAVLVALFGVFTIVRHTRAEEEAGRRELFGSTVVGRHAPLTAALIVVVAADLVLAALVTAGLVGIGLPVAGSLAAGLALAGVGIVFAAAAAVTAQLTEGARAATGLALAALGGAFLARAAGDAADSGLSWLSPIGWVAQVRPFTGERWWLLALFAATAALLAGAAFALSARRDLAAGVLPTRLGPATAPPHLAGPFGLAWRLHRGALLAWAAGFALGGAAFGGIAESIGTVLDSSPEVIDIVRRLGGGGPDLVDTFLAAEFGILALLASGYAVSATLRLRSEETDQRVEPVLATGVGRVRYAASHLLFALLGPAAALLAAGTTAGLVHGALVGDVPGRLGVLVAGALTQLPAVWVLTGIALALFGLLPRLTVLAWAALVAFVLFGQFGALLRLDPWLLDLSPFTHLPRTLGGDVAAAPLLWLVLVSAALVAVGLLGLQRRDVG